MATEAALHREKVILFLRSKATSHPLTLYTQCLLYLISIMRLYMQKFLVSTGSMNIVQDEYRVIIPRLGCLA